MNGDYPEHLKMLKADSKMTTITEFFEWLGRKGITYEFNALGPQPALPLNKLIDEYFEIDPRKIETERRLMLEELRERDKAKRAKRTGR